MATIILREIGGFWGQGTADLVRDIEAVTDDTIHLLVNSPGGAVFDGIEIMDALLRSPARVETRVTGLAASIASIIVVNASDHTEIVRGARMMIHDPISFVWGPASVMRKEADLLDGIADDLVDIYVEKMDETEDAVRELMRAETWYSAQEAVDAKLADTVVGGTPEAVARFAAYLAAYRNVPDDIDTPTSTDKLDLHGIERTLRDAGLTRMQARNFVSQGKGALQRDAGEQIGADQRDADQVLIGLDRLAEALRGVNDYVSA